MRRLTSPLAVLAFVLCGSGAALARPATAPAHPLVMAQQDEGEDAAGGGGDAAALVLRLGRMEEQVRALTGQVEQLQFQNHKLEDNLRKLQADTDFRFQDLQNGNGNARPAPAAPPAKRSEAPADTTLAAAPDGAAAVTAAPARKAGGDAFDPDANPGAPGAPRALGTTAASPPLVPRNAARPATGADDSRAPLDLMRPQGAPSASAAPGVIAAPAAAPRDPGSVASLVPGGTRDEYEADLSLYKQGQYDGAATGFAAFVDKYPKDRMVPDAVYLAGESFAKLGRHREAAEQFLKLSTDFSKAPRAPDALLKLGISLNALGAREQACATYQEVSRRYPNASGDVKAGVDRELKRARCTASG